MNETLYKALNINLDTHLNPLIPHNQARHLPKGLSHWLGYRPTPTKERPTLIQWLLTLVATIAGISVVGAVYNYAPALQAWNPPTLVASLGASAVLDYNTIKSPLAQPRNAILGHLIAAVVGTGISKAFQLAPAFFRDYDWVAAAVACGLASVAMSITNTVHPPGGATAILACTEAQIIQLGWRFPLIMLLASVLMLGVALVFNNTLRQYPTYWWTPEEVGQALPHRRKRQVHEDPEKAGPDAKAEDEHVEKIMESEAESEATLEHEFSNNAEFVEGIDEVVILPYKIRLPHHVVLSDEEVEVLQGLQLRVREFAEVN